MAITDNDVNLRGTERRRVAGLFSDCAKAQQAVDDLKAAGFSESQIGVARADEGDIDTGVSTSTTTTGERMGKHDDRGMWEKIKSAFGGGDEDRDRDNRREEVMDTAGMSYGDREADYAYGEDFPRHLSSAGMNENESRYFSHHLNRGSCLVTVNTSSGRGSDAVAILQRNGADIGAGAAEYHGEGREGELRGIGERRIQLLGEMLSVQKERVARGEVRLRKEVVTENKNIQVPVTREELVIERTNVSGDAPADARIGESGGKEIRVPLSEEEVRVEKQPMVTGEVRVGKRQITENKNISDTVRHEEVKVDREGDVDVEDKDLPGSDRKVA